MNLNDFDALSFDCYGTLIDWEAGIGSVLTAWAKRRGLTMSEEELLTAYADIEAAMEEEFPRELYPQILARSFTALGNALGVEVTAEDAQALATSVPDWPAFADSPEALARLAKKYKLIILSNIDNESFAGSNARLGVEFTSILTAENIGSYKPSPRNFAALDAERERLGIAPGRLLHVAQSLFHDHVPAKEAGLTTVWINRRHDRPGWGATPAPPAPVTPDWEFTSMAEFADATESE